MLITIKKKQNSNQWNYPLEPRLFPNGFRIGDSLIVENNSEKTHTELTIIAGYKIKEYKGDVPYISKKPKLIQLGDIINILPVTTKRKLALIRDNADYSNARSSQDGDTANLILSFLAIGKPIDVNGENFEKQSCWMLSQDKLDITQEHIDEIKQL